MPPKSLNSSVMKWPDKTQVDSAVRKWARQAATLHPELSRLGYFGSYARGNWGVGSDLDLVAIVSTSELPFERRPTTWKVENLPVPAELLVYTKAEWEQLPQQSTRFAQTLCDEVVWVYEK